jgi:hypothetical protein
VWRHQFPSKFAGAVVTHMRATDVPRPGWLNQKTFRRDSRANYRVQAPRRTGKDAGRRRVTVSAVVCPTDPVGKHVSSARRSRLGRNQFSQGLCCRQPAGHNGCSSGGGRPSP